MAGEMGARQDPPPRWVQRPTELPVVMGGGTNLAPPGLEGPLQGGSGNKGLPGATPGQGIVQCGVQVGVRECWALQRGAWGPGHGWNCSCDRGPRTPDLHAELLSQSFSLGRTLISSGVGAGVTGVGEEGIGQQLGRSWWDPGHVTVHATPGPGASSS